MVFKSIFGLALPVLAAGVAGCASAPVPAPAPAVPPASSYSCQSSQPRGMLAQGHGDYGCHFYLREPESQRLLADTSYIVKVFATAEARSRDHLPLFEFEGTTDGVARTAFIRAPFPLTRENILVLQKVGTGEYGRIPRAVRGSDGEAVPGASYTVTWCGRTYSGVTDEYGNGVLVTSEQSCPIRVAFYRPK